ncbi:MAG TPA: alpha-ribazole phosphatase family protein [Leptospiraceae bacterium]|nr:alpha-ribazole phosphatase family protein [Leptospirales bacterium]HMW58046.1 alpha-ribazole phosphatase family protein [Leptospiraceae bacterium]HMY44883.1 alpha-ribazole phosphatase family protein [Leptospiraceae bacterium]HNE22380.1 alpha-ribazole phosphatase family protein [Leptospiraceae bacterium]HNJ32611.1 alpha-ribazole phosphatase family protein [Leptospiraceae bacterium]
MDLYVVRHPPVAVDKGVCYGQLDVALKPGFEVLGNSLRESLPSLPVYSSHLSRCRQLAHLIDPDHAVDARLAEMHFGEWEGLRWDDIPRTELDLWMNDYVTQRTPGGESFADVEDRLTEFLQTLRDAGKEGAVLISHAGVIRSLLIRWTGLSPDKAFRKQIEFGSVHHISV